MKKYIKEFIKYIIIITILLNIVSYYKSLELNKQKLSLTNLTLVDGLEYKIKDNKPLIIYFWATWCPICKIESPNIDSLSKNYEVLSIAVNSGDNESIKEYVKQKGYNFKVYNDFDSSIANSFNIKAYPTILIYDKNKNLAFSDVGYTSTLGLYLRLIWASF